MSFTPTADKKVSAFKVCKTRVDMILWLAIGTSKHCNYGEQLFVSVVNQYLHLKNVVFTFNTSTVFAGDEQIEHEKIVYSYSSTHRLYVRFEVWDCPIGECIIQKIKVFAWVGVMNKYFQVYPNSWLHAVRACLTKISFYFFSAPCGDGSNEMMCIQLISIELVGYF